MILLIELISPGLTEEELIDRRIEEGGLIEARENGTDERDTVGSSDDVLGEDTGEIEDLLLETVGSSDVLEEDTEETEDRLTVGRDILLDVVLLEVETGMVPGEPIEDRLTVGIDILLGI